MLRFGWLLLALLIAGPVHAATLERAHQVVLMVYDIGLYTSELDRIMAEADTRGMFSSANRAREHAAARSSMLAQRQAVLSVATANVAARATDPQLDALLAMATSSGAPANQALVDSAVTIVKAGFEQAVWDQLASTARGAREFPCTKDQRSHCS
jgi:hypothetical protein